MNSKINLSNLRFIDEIPKQLKELGSGCIIYGEDTLKKYHRKKKGKRYLPYYVEEYLLFDDFKYKVFGIKGKYKKYRKIGEKIK